MSSGVEAAVAGAFRDEWGRVLATLIRMTGDWDLAEECAQDAFAAALERWPRDGVPRRPGAWLTTTARNRAVDRLRRGATESAKVREIPVPSHTDEPDDLDDLGDDDRSVRDDRLRLIFTCCHPALPLEARVALTLRTLAGLTTAEIARAFLVPEPTMAKRLARAKAKIRHAGIPYRVPPGHLLPERTGGVLAVLYLLFNEGYAATAGDRLVRQDLCAEAIRLARTLAMLMPDEPEALGLLALMLLHDARRDARTADGRLVLLEDQDRDLWDAPAIAEGRRLLDRALRMRQPGAYQLQAAIAALHDEAASPVETDWRQIVGLYDELLGLAPSPVVALNRAVAVALAGERERGPAGLVEGLSLVDGLAGELASYSYLHAARGDLLRRLDRRTEARTAYRRALELTANEPERAFLRDRAASLG